MLGFETCPPPAWSFQEVDLSVHVTRHCDGAKNVKWKLQPESMQRLLIAMLTQERVENLFTSQFE